MCALGRDLRQEACHPRPVECGCDTEIRRVRHRYVAVALTGKCSRWCRNPAHHGKPITSCKSAFVLLKDFRPTFGRVARKDGHTGMTEEATLFLDVDTIVLRGAFGEATWGTPVDASNDPKIRDWIHGLRQDGGAG